MNTVANPLFRCLVRMVIITHRANTELTCEFLINVVNPYRQWNNALGTDYNLMMMINYDKTHYMIFTPTHHHGSKLELNLSMNNHQIRRVSTTKFLGVHLDENLSCKTH